MKRFLLFVIAALLVSSPVHAQNPLKKLGERAKNAAEQNIGNKVEKGINDILNGNVGKKEKNNDAKGQQEQPTQQTTTSGQPAITTTGNTTPSLTAGDLGLPKNTDGPQPQENALANASYTALITYPSHKQEIYYDGAARRQYGVRQNEPTTRSLLIADSLIVYNIDDAKKTISVISLNGAEGARIYQKNDYKKEVVKYRDRWCILETYVAQEHDAQGATMQTRFAVWKDIETGITLREDQNGGQMQEISHITLGSFPDKAFNLPQDYKITRMFDLGQLMKDKAAAENSEDPAAAARELGNNLGKYLNKNHTK